MIGSDWNALPLIGRDSELASLARGLASAAQGTSSFCLIAGSHGLGKTRLLEATVQQALKQGYSVARAVAYQSDANVPYSVVADGLNPLVRSIDATTLRTLTRGVESELAQIVPAFSGAEGRSAALTDTSDLTTRLRWHAAQFLTRLSVRAPVLFTVDNAQWADPSSVALLHFVLRHASDARLMIAAAYNPLEAEAAAPVRSIAKAAAALRFSQLLELEPLSATDIGALLVQRFSVDAADISDFAVFLHARTLGNPFFVEETIRTLVERGTLRQTSGRWVGWDIEDIDVPSTIREVLLERVNALTPAARTVADVASVAGMRVPHTLLQEITGLDSAGFTAAIGDLRRAAMVKEAEEKHEILYDFTHPLLQRTLYEEAGAARRRELHALIANRLEAHFGTDTESHATELAFHYVRANAPALSGKTVRYLEQAGRVALGKHADREAARYLQHALDLLDRGAAGDDDVSERIDLLKDLARARQRLGESDASGILWERARDLCRTTNDLGGLARIERRIGLLAFWSGQPSVALERYDVALQHAREADHRVLEARILLARGVALMALGRPQEAKDAVEAAFGVAEVLGDVRLRARVRRALLIIYAYAGPAEVANELARQVLVDAEAVGDLGFAWAAHHATAALACFTANAEAVAHHVAEGDRIARALQSPLLSAQIAEPAIEYASAKGDWAEGLSLAERSIPVARAMSPRSLLPRLLVWKGTILLNRDEIEHAKACFDEAWELSRAGSELSGADLNAVIVAHIGQAAYCLTTREWVTAIEFAQRGIDIADRHGMTSWTLHRLLPMLAESALWIGDFTLAERSAARLRTDSARFNHALGEAWAFTVDQLVSRWRDQQPGVIERLLDAADQLEEVPFVFHAARLRRHMGRLLTMDGDRDRAAKELRKAHDVFLKLGAALELRLTREAMRELGVRPPVQTNAPGGALTQRELEIARLVALHKTNKEIARSLDISSRTVSTHLSNMFVKLGVTSRGALGDFVRDNPSVERPAST